MLHWMVSCIDLIMKTWAHSSLSSLTFSAWVRYMCMVEVEVEQSRAEIERDSQFIVPYEMFCVDDGNDISCSFAVGAIATIVMVVHYMCGFVRSSPPTFETSQTTWTYWKHDDQLATTETCADALLAEKPYLVICGYLLATNWSDEMLSSLSRRNQWGKTSHTGARVDYLRSCSNKLTVHVLRLFPTKCPFDHIHSIP